MAYNNDKREMAIENTKSVTAGLTLNPVDEAVQVDERKESVVETEITSDLIYGVLDTPPIHITIISGLQVRCL